MYSVDDILWYYRQHGIETTVKRILGELSVLIFAGLFGLLDRKTDSESQHICVIPRSGTIDQDTTAIISQNEREHNKTLHIAVDSPSRERDKNQEILTRTDKIDLIELHSLEFVKALAVSKTIISKDRMWQYRILRDRSTKFIRIPHGIPAKKPQVPPDTSCSLSNILTDRFDFHENFYYTVASDLEMYREVADMGRKRTNLALYGYPRYDRIRHLTNHPNDAFVDDETSALLESPEDHYNILYAPTHKDDVYETTLFPFSDTDLEALKTFLAQHNIRIFVRLHVREEDSDIIDQYVDGDTILYAGNDISGSAAELMPYFDALITDYSSIYLDYVLFDKPILFVQDEIERFRELRGFAFDYEQYWPGPKIQSQEEFLDEISNAVINNGCGYQYQRQFVKDTFHPPRGEGFLRNIYEHSSEAR